MKQLFDSLNKEFLENSVKAGDENDENKMRELLVKGRGMERETEKGKKEVAELEMRLLPWRRENLCKIV